MKIKLLLFILFASQFVLAQKANSKICFTELLFADTFPMQITIKTDFKKLKREKFKGNYQPALLIYVSNDSLISKKIKIKARGNNRKENCLFPPIAIKFKSEEVKKGMPNQKIKLVISCKPGKAYENYVLKEYLCYKLYNSFSLYSFKVRLLNLKLIDTGTKKLNEMQMYAFIIEPQKAMSKRLGAKLDKNKRLSQPLVDQEKIMELAMFQFMIGNFDWAVPTQQNLKLIRPINSPHKIIPIPYDFDYCGLVNASYAIPNEKLGIASVKDRIFLGECKPEKDIQKVIEKFIGHKAQFYMVVSNFKFLSEKDRGLISKYLDKFYEILGSGKFYKKYHQKTCKKIRKS